MPAADTRAHQEGAQDHGDPIEGLHSSHLATCRKARREGALRGLGSKKRGAKPKTRNPLEGPVASADPQSTYVDK